MGIPPLVDTTWPQKMHQIIDLGLLSLRASDPEGLLIDPTGLASPSLALKGLTQLIKSPDVVDRAGCFREETA